MKKECIMFHTNVKVMFKVNGYEFKVRNTSETTKQVSLHDRDGSLLCSYPLHDYSTDNFDYSGITCCLIEFNRYCNKLNVLEVDNGKLIYKFKVFKSSDNSFKVELRCNKSDRVNTYYSGSLLEINKTIQDLMRVQLNIANEYSKEMITRMKVIEYKGKDSNW